MTEKYVVELMKNNMGYIQRRGCTNVVFNVVQADKVAEEIVNKHNEEVATLTKEIFTRVMELSPAYHYDTLSVAQKNLVQNEDFLFLQQLKDIAKEYGAGVGE